MTEGVQVILDWLSSVSNDPYAFVMGAFPWGEAGTSLEKFDGPEEWQREELLAIRDALATGALTEHEAIQRAAATGHGVGKSALVAMIILWGFSTAPDTRGTVTANTETQLKTKTWAELGKWFNMFVARDHFTLTATALMSKDPSRERTWRIDMVPWSEKNTEAFAGLHNKGKRLLLIMDEASAIPDIIWEVSEGALTDSDTEILWLAFGNPTRNTGRFKECFEGGRFAGSWITRQLDSRTVTITNKKRLDAWIRDYGEDSDFVRIRVKGEFPRVGEMEFFSTTEIDLAMAREVYTQITDPLALGVDVARFGANNSCLFPRKGRDARSILRQTYSGMDTVELSNRVFDFFTAYRPDGIFIDEGGVGGGVVDNCRNKQLFVLGVQFGGKDDISGIAFNTSGIKCANKRSAMYVALREWLKTGAIPNDPRLRTTMQAIKYVLNKKDEIQLIPKEEIGDGALSSDLILDDLDALALTFGGPLASHAGAGGEHPHKPSVESEYDPYAPERMVA